MSATLQYPNYSPGLEGVIGGITKISEIDSQHSSLIYRGINVHELAEDGSFEETAYLLLYGKLPDRKELDEFNKTLGAERDVPNEVYETLRLVPKNAHPMDQIRALTSHRVSLACIDD